MLAESRFESAPALEEEEQELSGWLVIGHEVRSFRPCAHLRALWLIGASPALEQLIGAYRSALPDAPPYTPLFATLTGRFTDPPEEGFGAVYEEGLLAMRLVQVWPEGSCQAGLTATEAVDETPSVRVLKGRGIGVESADGRNKMVLWLRAQLRYSFFDADAASIEEGAAESVSSFDLNRARLKIEGNVFHRWLQYYFEHDLRGNNLLDLRFTLARYPWLQLRVGQWKVIYNRERVDSSGKLAFVDRSIVTQFFTLDRQIGLSLMGRLWEGKRIDSRYAIGVYNGDGRGASNPDSSFMWVGRYQWNFLGRDLPFSEVDLKFHEKPTATLSFAAADNTSAHTRFSTAGGGQLPGFEPGAPGQYSLRQAMQETAFKYRGFSWQQEYHWKEVTDNVNGTTTKLRGMYAQAGLFPWGLSRRIPRSLELGFRYSFVDPDVDRLDDRRQEYSAVVNWFFKGHDNKLTLDLSLFTEERSEVPRLKGHRLRFQWDISF